MKHVVYISKKYERGNGGHYGYYTYNAWPFPVYPEIGDEVRIEYPNPEWEFEHDGGPGVEYNMSGGTYKYVRKEFWIDGDEPQIWLHFEDPKKLKKGDRYLTISKVE